MKTHFVIGLFMVFASLYLMSCIKDIEESQNYPAKPYFKVIQDGEFTELYGDVTDGGTFSLHLIGQKSVSPLKSVSFLEEGYIMPASRILINDQEISANPLVLDERHSYSLEFMVKIKSHQELGLRKKYTINLEDMEGNTSNIVLYLTSVMAYPELTISANDNHEIVVPPGELISVRITAKKGSSDLISMSILLKNDYKCHSVIPELIKPSDIYFGHTLISALSNPIIIEKTDSKGFDKTLYIRVPTIPGLYAYCIMLQDSYKNTVDDWLRVKVMDFEESVRVPPFEIK